MRNCLFRLGENVDESVDVVVTSSGHVTAMVPARYDVTCMYEFRGNVWLCPLKFASWSYPGSEVTLLRHGPTQIAQIL